MRSGTPSGSPTSQARHLTAGGSVGSLLVSDVLSDHFVRELHGRMYGPIYALASGAPGRRKCARGCRLALPGGAEGMQKC